MAEGEIDPRERRSNGASASGLGGASKLEGSPIERRRSNARTLRIAAVLLSVVILLVVALVGWNSWKESERSARDNGLGLQALVHSQVARMFDLAEVLLELVSTTALQLDLDDPAVVEDLHRDLALIDQALPLVNSIWVIDSDGNVITSTVGRSAEEAATVNASDRTYFEIHKQGYRGSYVDGPYLGKLTGVPFFSVSRSIVDGDGNFAGIAMVSFDTQAVTANLRSVNRSFGAEVQIFRESGQMLVAVPEMEGPYVDWRASAALLDAAGSVDTAPDRIDSTFVWKLGDYPIYVAVTVPYALAIEQWIGKNWHLWVSLIVSTLAIGLIYLTLRRRAVNEDRVAEETSREIARQTGNLQRAVHEKDLLLRELHHRVKNNMQVVMSLLALQAQRSKGDPRTYFQESQRRLAAVAKMHQHLYLLADTAELSLVPYFSELAPEIAAAHGCEDEVTIDVSGDDVSVGLDQATAIVLMAGEVMSNAFKHAFADGRRGTLTVRVTRTEEGARLEIVDDGPGFEPEQAQSDSLGMLLIRNLAIQAKGTVIYRGDGGGCFRLDFALTPAAAQA